MSLIDSSALLSFVHDRGTVTLDELCRSLCNQDIDFIAPAQIGEIHATMLAAGWIHACRRIDGADADMYERPMQDIPAAPPSRSAAAERATVTAIDILQAASQAIVDRAASRDLPAERSMARTVAAFNALTGQNLTERDGWLFMATLKAARVIAGAHNGDDYTDGAAYFALAGETADRDSRHAPSAQAEDHRFNHATPGGNK